MPVTVEGLIHGHTLCHVRPTMKDTIIFRSEVSPSNKSPFMKYPADVQKYFMQYGGCEVIHEHHSSQRGLDRHAIVMRFTECAVANRVKQKYNGRALFGARITTSWIDMPQMRELCMPISDKKGLLLKAGDSGYLAKGIPSIMTAQEREARLPGLRLQYSSQSGTDTESIDSGSQYLSEGDTSQSSSPFSAKFQAATQLEQMARLSPVNTPLSLSRDASPSRSRSSKRSISPHKERHDSLERPESRSSSHSKERELESGRASGTSRSRKRKHEDDESSSQRSRSPSTHSLRSSSNSGVYVPRSKRARDDSSERQSAESKKSIFDRLGPTIEQQEDLFQIETYGEVSTKMRKGTESGFKSPTGMKSPGAEGPSRHSSLSSEKDVKYSPTEKKGKEREKESVHNSERETNSSSSSREGSRRGARESRDRRERKGSDGSHRRSSPRHSRSRKDKTTTAKPDTQAPEAVTTKEPASDLENVPELKEEPTTPVTQLPIEEDQDQTPPASTMEELVFYQSNPYSEAWQQLMELGEGPPPPQLAQLYYQYYQEYLGEAVARGAWQQSAAIGGEAVAQGAWQQSAAIGGEAVARGAWQQSAAIGGQTLVPPTCSIQMSGESLLAAGLNSQSYSGNIVEGPASDYQYRIGGVPGAVVPPVQPCESVVGPGSVLVTLSESEEGPSGPEILWPAPKEEEEMEEEEEEEEEEVEGEEEVEEEEEEEEVVERPKKRWRIGVRHRALIESTMEDFESQAEILVTSCKLMASQSPHNTRAIHNSLETALWQLACSLATKFHEKTVH